MSHVPTHPHRTITRTPLRRAVLLLTALTLLRPATSFAQRAAPDKLKAELTETLRLTLRPAAPPVPALRHRFLPEVADQVPGNAAILYLVAARQLADARATAAAANKTDKAAPSDDDAIDDLLEAPLDKFDKTRARALVDRYRSALEQLRLASLRDRCDFDPPFRTEGFRTLLPYLNDARALSRLAALEARTLIAEGHPDAAIAALAPVFVFARHLNDNAFLIQLLVGAGVAQRGFVVLDDLIQRSDAPNLYWALGTIPAPLFDLRRCWQFERAGVFFTIPHFKEARAGRLTAEQWRDALAVITQVGQMSGDRAAREIQGFGAAFLAAQQYTPAKRYLLDVLKLPADQVERMPVAAALGVYHVNQFDRLTQESDKWLTLPFPQAYPHLRQIEDRMTRGDLLREWGPLAMFAPALTRATVNIVLPDRRLAALRTVEAIRAHAAAHAGKAPASLDQLIDTPAIPDPITGRPFTYHPTDTGFTLEAPPADESGPRKTGLHLEATWAR